ncbi:MAG: DUF3127 domain-containing protein [Puniceicoccaceae bacterium]
MYEMEGKVKEVFEEQTFGSGFRKKEFVVTTDEKFPQDIKFECVQDKIAQLEGVAAGDQVKVRFDLRGREWNGRYFVNLSAWQVNRSDGGSGAEAPAGGPEFEAEPSDDIPF